MGNSHAMKPFVPVLFAGNQAVFSAYRTHSSLDNFANLWPDWDRSANQLEQLVGKQDHDAKHEVEQSGGFSPVNFPAQDHGV
jgi:hypothetical protein